MPLKGDKFYAQTWFGIVHTLLTIIVRDTLRTSVNDINEDVI